MGKNTKNLKGGCWWVLHMDWNGEARARGKRTGEGGILDNTTERVGLKGVGAGCAIWIESLNIYLGWAGCLELALRVLWQGNINPLIERIDIASILS